MDDILIGPDTSIDRALTVLNDAHRRIVLVVDGDRRLLGVATDSNFRRAMLERHDFHRPIAEIMTRSPITAVPDMSEPQILHLMERSHCHELPVIDASGKVVDLLSIETMLLRRSEGSPRVAVVMAGGRGERLRPITESIPKPLVEVGGRPILFTILDQLMAAEFGVVYLAVNYMAKAIEQAVALQPAYARLVRYIREEERLGTAGALSLLPEPPSGPITVMNGDLLTAINFPEMMRFHRHEQNALTVALREEKVRIPYGVAQLEGTRIVGMREKPEYTHFVNTGVYVVDPSALALLERGVPTDMTTLIDRTIASGRRVGCFPVHEYWLDIGVPSQLRQADQDYDTVMARSE